VVQEGSFGLVAHRAEGEAQEIAAGRGALLGELAMMTPTKRLATATALEPSTVIRISRGLFLKMLEGYPETAQKLRDAMAARTEQWTREIENVRAGLEGKSGK
jgi:CRP-like cAMP-binding protein